MLTNHRNIDGRILGLFLLAVTVALLAPFKPKVFIIALLGYSSLILASSFIGSTRIGSAKLLPLMVLLFAIEHLSYLIGLIVGIFHGPWKTPDTKEPIHIARHIIHPGDYSTVSSNEGHKPTP